jgi:hypothetical protein
MARNLMKNMIVGRNVVSIDKLYKNNKYSLGGSLANIFDKLRVIVKINLCI